ncbi:hypothetical protein J3458_013312 [Metarhizium acridum]|uniref:Uncharacterized protein n=1 Tax=Metarhizium acridum (strain CQMa 102) TaxID=655827 RepID=E9EEU8_METAQ|nr:uncharacterized protein MAC_08396 [Metarhizium acridum CQMa 102]EFY85559.1 hypothetical protein MAC_08396 [Metarhizium acridum CQMa 102]KAG8412881.1 hypothetical protein J3458_013312 [Metarhizium acridum]
MGDSLNIQNMLETGYFTTARTRSTGPPENSSRSPGPSRYAPPETFPPPVPVHGQVPRTVYLAPAPEPKRWRTPPPTVEDETESLAREYGSPAASVVAEEEPQCRGQVDQKYVLEDVHEHNPERRFVVVPESLKRPNPSANDRPKKENREETQDLGERTSSQRSPRLEDNYGKQKDAASKSRYGPNRRKSQQDLPAIDTALDGRHRPEYHRTRSAATGHKPDYFDPRQSRPYGDYLLSPDVIQSGTKGREKRYHGMSQSSGGYHERSPSSSSHKFETSRGSDRDYYGKDRASSSSASRSNTDLSSRSRKRMTNDVDPRYRDEYSYSRSDRRDASSYGCSDNPGRKLSPRSSREPSRSGDEYSRSPRSSGYLSSKPVVVQEEMPLLHQDRKDDGPVHVRSSSRTPTIPPMAQAATAATAAGVHMMDDASKNASREPIIMTPRTTTDTPRASNFQLPYPEDDLPPDVGLGIQDGNLDARHPKFDDMGSVSMPEPPSTVATTTPGRSFDSNYDTPTTPSTAAATPLTWQPPIFNPNREAIKAEKPVGAYRRYSESHGNDTSDSLPECPRQKPVVGMVDWLTLPHTNFNICPTCYDSVFSTTEYRTFFKPILRPSDEPIACDFGVSPWYRIAWLLTVKDGIPDMRLLQQLATINSAPNREPCPGTKKATRTWLTVKDPHTRQPVTDFSVCYQCARSVELLLPNLTGVFVPIDARPKQDVCSLHFTPERKQFVLFFDVLETTSDKALEAKQLPNVDDLARDLWCLTVGSKCREDSPVIDGYWHTMQFLPQFTVCSNCFHDVVQPKLGDGNVVARNFYMKAQRLPSATCQLYSTRMRDIFRRSCRRNDPNYLQEKVVQRRRIEKDIYERLVKLDRANVKASWKEEQVEKLVEEWKRWE